uniref:Sushi domain-containing protein n=1 Tax=Varanus komodoensis TaxID=61221 RepID=A0A8D2J336_VARKO
MYLAGDAASAGLWEPKSRVWQVDDLPEVGQICCAWHPWPPHVALGLALQRSCHDASASVQDCLTRQQVANLLQQVQKLLSSHEAKEAPFSCSLASPALRSPAESCPLLPAPLNGRRLGRKRAVGHEVHFTCHLGFRLAGSETRTCLENHTWSGQQPSCKSSNASFSRQPRCADNPLGSRQCSCDAGFQMRAGGLCQGKARNAGGQRGPAWHCRHAPCSLCAARAPLAGFPSPAPCSVPDVDECQTFQSSPHTRICLHECVNLPGSYQCVCPSGYWIQTDQNTCHDLDECAENQHNCSHGQSCVNTFGGFRCVRPECPKTQLNTSYVKTSAWQCERSPCPMDSKACQRAAHSISFHYLPLQSNRGVPRVLFKMSTSRFVGDSLRFAILGGNGQGKLAVQRSDQHTGELVLTRPVVGPATLQAELEMSEYAQKSLLGKHIFKITVFVSQYEF